MSENYPADDANRAIRATVSVGVFAALIIAGSYIVVPLPFSPVPIALQSFFVLLAGLVLGPKWGAFTVFLYLSMGAVGLPVFAGGQGGPAHFLRPTAGYLVGYLPAVALAGAVAAIGRRASRKKQRALDALGAALGSLVIYAVGAPVLSRVTGMSMSAALAAGIVPFLPGDLIKVLVAATFADRLRRRFAGPDAAPSNNDA